MSAKTESIAVTILNDWRELLRKHRDLCHNPPVPKDLNGLGNREIRRIFSKINPAKLSESSLRRIVASTWRELLGEKFRGVREEMLDAIRHHVVADPPPDDAEKIATFLVELLRPQDLHDSFWKPLRGRNIAIASICAPRHHYDLIPQSELVKHVVGHIDQDAGLLFFDEFGKLIGDCELARFQSFVFVGRPALYASHPFFYPSTHRPGPIATLTMPSLAGDAQRFLKGELNPQFHRIDCHHESLRPLSFFAKNERDSQTQRKYRTDYALIQRLTAPENRAPVVILAGSTALGTRAAVSQATKERFATLASLSALPFRDEDNIEILLQVTAYLDWTDKDQARFEAGELLTKHWNALNCTPLFVFVNGQQRFRSPSSTVKFCAGDEFRSRFVAHREWMQERYRYAENKFSALLGKKWPEVCSLARGESRTLLPKPDYFEIHPTERCQLGCLYCRGDYGNGLPGLREVPLKQERAANLLGLVEQIYEVNSGAFIRFSGTIGEPLLHKQIATVFAKLAREYKTLRWGLTTNGLMLGEEKFWQPLLKANYVHVSLDAGTDKNYQAIKRGSPGDFHKVLRNIENFVSRKRAEKEQVEIIVSFLLQEENYTDISELSQTLKNYEVNAFEIKMQHFDVRRAMSQEKVEKAYQLIGEVQTRDSGPNFRVIVVQSEREAIEKIRGNSKAVDFQYCYANILGLNATVDPRGNLQTCCQYYQKTLGVQGGVINLPDAWQSKERRELLRRNPRCFGESKERCSNCSPSDEFVNRFVQLLSDGYQADASFLSWVEQYFVCDGSKQSIETLSADNASNVND